MAAGSNMSGPTRDDAKSLVFFAVTFALSMGAHAVTIVAMPSTAPVTVVNRRVEMELFVEPPKVEPPPEPPKPEEPPKPVEPPKVVKVKPPPKAIADAPPPKENLPPPPNQEPPPEPPSKPVPVVIGLTLDSTTQAGGFAVQVGNSTMGKSSNTVVDPANVKPYSAPKYALPGTADQEPTVDFEPRVPEYPPEAKKNEIEGDVRLRISLDASGTVTDVKVIRGLGYGLDEAAVSALKKFRFKPAIKGGEPVAYTMTYTYRFFLVD